MKKLFLMLAIATVASTVSIQSVYAFSGVKTSVVSGEEKIDKKKKKKCCKDEAACKSKEGDKKCCTKGDKKECHDKKTSSTETKTEEKKAE
jgi:hypothetical protein